MSYPPGWCAKYSSIPFVEKGRGPDGYDCWGLVRAVLMERFGVESPCDLRQSYVSTNDKYSVSATTQAAILTVGRKLPGPEPGAVIILRLAGRPWHCGIVVDEQWMMHVVAGANVVCERLDSWAWSDRIEGFFRYVG